MADLFEIKDFTSVAKVKADDKHGFDALIFNSWT